MQIALAGVPPRSKDMLDFVVVGAGIAGLASAWSLRLAGHRVTVLEKLDPEVLFKCREGFRCTPAMNQILNDWGIGGKMSQISIPIDQISILDGGTGEELGLIPFNSVKEALPAQFNCVQYGAMFRLFYDLANDAGVHLHFNSKVVSLDPWKGTVTCQDGLQLTADVIVGADGTESIVRPIVLGPSASPPQCDKVVTIDLAVATDVARKDQDLAALLDQRSWTAWCGDDCGIHGVLAGPSLDNDYALVMNITIQGQELREAFPVNLDSLKLDSFEPRAQKLIKLADQVNETMFVHYEPFDTWVHESGRVVLVGEAAHPMIPSASQNPTSCIEDAMTLSMLFSLPATKPQTGLLLSIYEELRQPRCAAVQRYVRRKRDILTLPYGSGQRRRDALLRDQRAFHQDDGADDEFLCNTYTGFIHIYCFDARAVVQDWWFKLGRSKFIYSASTESEGEDEDEDVDAPTLSPIVVDAEVERDGPTYPIISDHFMGDDDDAICEARTRREVQK